MKRTCTQESGLALIVALMMLSVLSTLGLGLSLALSVDPMAAANQRQASSMLYMARAGLELAAGELSAAASWDAWLSGAATTALVDGAPAGTRTLPTGDTIDISRLTNQLTCGSNAPCSDTQINTTTSERPWGPDNPRWQPFIYGSGERLGMAGHADQYVIVWVGDDGEEVDGAPLVDGGEGPGGGTVRIVSEAFGPFHSRQSMEAHVSRRCETVDEVRACTAGVRIWGWRARAGGR